MSTHAIQYATNLVSIKPFKRQRHKMVKHIQAIIWVFDHFVELLLKGLQAAFEYNKLLKACFQFHF